MTLIVLNYSISRSIYSRSLNQSSYPRHVKSQSRSDRREDLFRQTCFPPTELLYGSPFNIWDCISFADSEFRLSKWFFETRSYYFNRYCYLRLENWIFHVTQRICALHFILREMTFGRREISSYNWISYIIRYKCTIKICLQITFQNNSNDNVPYLRKIERIIYFYIHAFSKN